METTDTGFDPSQSLQLIAETINKTKENIKEYSFCFMLWGWLIAIASFSFYILHSFTDFQYYYLPFPVLVGIGIVITISHYLRGRHITETFLTFFLKRMWLVLAGCFILAVLANIFQGHQPFTYTTLIGGIGTLVTGLVLRFRPLVAGGVLFLVAYVISMCVLAEYRPLIQGIAVITGYLIPGYLLKYTKG